jgi:predicted NBD/HSP70 family sugar kinase
MPSRRSSQTSLREANSRRVLETLRAGRATQAELARSTALSGATVSTIVRDLLAAGAVESVDHPGRGQLVQLSARSGLTAGIAFGHSRALLALGDLTSTVRDERVVPLDPALSADEAVGAALDALVDLLTAQGVDVRTLVSVGVSLATPLTAGGSVAHHTRWAGYDVQAGLSLLLPCPVHVDNDANLGARAESRWGELTGRSVGAWVKASTGIGVGLILDGQVHRGAKGLAGELGHVSTDPHGGLCGCGNRGCLELTAGTPALVREYAAVTGRTLTALELVAAAVDGDVAARRLISDAGTRIGTALAGLVTLIDPERVVVGGDLAEAGDLLLDPLVAALRQGSMPAVADDVSVAVSALGERAEVLGALALALDHAAPQVTS